MVEKIDIRVGDKTISLTPDEARALKRDLDELFLRDNLVNPFSLHGGSIIPGYRRQDSTYIGVRFPGSE